jgi:hypothetical protein
MVYTHCSQNTRTRPTASFSFYLFFIPSMCLIYLRLFRIANVPHNEKPDESSKFPFCYYPGICIYSRHPLQRTNPFFIYAASRTFRSIYLRDSNSRGLTRHGNRDWIGPLGPLTDHRSAFSREHLGLMGWFISVFFSLSSIKRIGICHHNIMHLTLQHN